MKDKENILDYNVWCGTEYYNDVTGFYNVNNSLILSSNGFSSIGECSLKVLKNNNGLDRVLKIPINNLGETTNINITFDIYSPNNSVSFNLTKDVIIYTINVPKSATSQHISLSTTTDNNEITLYGVLKNNDKQFNIDNIKITLQ